MENCEIRGDLSNIRIGRNCVIEKGATITPSQNQESKLYNTVQIENFVLIGENATVEASSIGSFVYIGKNSVIGNKCILKECSAVADNVHLPAGTVLPPYTCYTGEGTDITTLCGLLPDCTKEIITNYILGIYNSLIVK
ncbi:Dynactin subunit 5 [Intoshia linei]|uniref:Dynactin subunit 5 n=1 Tax=Intoshia linei TaxID=1819745 RepID=A0A177AZS6_9BILA|nr:Dynactin subunit 5 [Intoshia linei]